VLGINMLRARNDLLDHDKEALDMMEESSRFMTETLNDVLRVEKIEKGELNLNYGKFSLSDMVQRSFSTLKSISTSKQITLRLSGIDGIIIIFKIFSYKICLYIYRYRRYSFIRAWR
jgi:signal transduction histidine kinase